MQPAAASQQALDRSIALPGGRRLFYHEVGDPSGRPVFLFHGLPGSRIQRHPDDAIAARLGLRLILPDRPGCGLSDPAPKRRVTDWPTDLIAMADALSLARFAVGGWSGGAPYACAVAAALPERVTCLRLVSPMAPLDRPGALDDAPDWARRGLKLVQTAPFLVGPTVSAWHRSMVREPDRFAGSVSARLSRSDRALFARPELQGLFTQIALDATRQGPQGLTTELKLLAAPWGVDLARIQAPTRIWHGDDDRVLPLSMARRLADAIPGATLEIVPGGGHFVAFEIWEDLLASFGEA